jgi:stringent starvation protein B
MTSKAPPISSNRPYLIRAIYEWCNDNGLTPHLAVKVDANVQVPRESVKDDQIVLNIGAAAVNALQLGNEWIAFKARFAGVVRDIMLPTSHVLAIYARENGQGMTFELDLPTTSTAGPAAAQADPEASAATTPAPTRVPAPKKPHLTSVEPLGPAAPGEDPPPPPKSPSKRPVLVRVK